MIRKDWAGFQAFTGCCSAWGGRFVLHKKHCRLASGKRHARKHVLGKGPSWYDDLAAVASKQV